MIAKKINNEKWYPKNVLRHKWAIAAPERDHVGHYTESIECLTIVTTLEGFFKPFDKTLCFASRCVCAAYKV